MYQITSADVEKLETEGYDVWTISLWKIWLTQVPNLHAAMEQLSSAFEGVQLNDGIGLSEADAIDDYATIEARAAARETDEKHDWRKISSALLNRHYCAITYFDPQGFVFHLPAFLLAELRDEFHYSMVETLVEKHPTSTAWIDRLDSNQRAALVQILEVVRRHPEFHADEAAFDKAILRISR